jgi:hypothetical protein
MEVARTYRGLLRAEELIDPAEMLWQAARALPERRPVLVWGYPRLGRDEVAFIDAVAGEGSVLRLPYAEDHTFYENRETAEELERRGWAVDRTLPQASWDVEVPVEAHSWPETMLPTDRRCSLWRTSTAYRCKPSTRWDSLTRGLGTG